MGKSQPLVWWVLSEASLGFVLGSLVQESIGDGDSVCWDVSWNMGGLPHSSVTSGTGAGLAKLLWFCLLSSSRPPACSA